MMIVIVKNNLKYYLIYIYNKMSITEALRTNCPNLSASSLKTYSSVLRNLQKDMKGEGIEWFSNNDKYGSSSSC